MNRTFSALLVLLLLTACGDDLATATEKLRLGESPLIRAAAARRIGEIGGDEAVRVLTMHGLRDGAASVRKATIESLAPTEHRRLVDLFGAALGDPDPSVQAAAAEALVTQGGRMAVHHLEVAYARSGNPSRAIYADALVRLGASPRKAVEDAARRQLERTLESLQSGAPAERIGAAEELGRSGRPAAVSALLPLLSHPTASMVAVAARALGEAGERRAVPQLIKLLESPDATVRRAAAEALGVLGDPSVAPHLEGLALTGTPAESAEALTILAGFDGPEVTAGLCRVMLGATDPETARTAAEAVAGRGGTCPEATESVGRSLERRGSAVLPALAAVEGLGVAATNEGIKARVLALCESDDDEVLAAALNAAAGAGFSEAADSALATLDRVQRSDAAGREEWVADPLPTVWGWGKEQEAGADHQDDDDDHSLMTAEQERVLEGLGVRTEHQYRDRFQDLMGRVAERRAQQEVDGLEARGGAPVDLEARRAGHLSALTTDAPAARVEIVDDLPPRSVPILKAVIRAVGPLAGVRAVPPLRGLLGHADGGVRVAAVQGLSSVEGEEATEALEDALSDSQPAEVVAAAAQALGGRQGGLEPLIQAGLRTEAVAQVAVARVLAARGGPQATEALRAMLSGPAAAEAAGGLARAGGAEVVPLLVEHLRRRDAQGRAAALEALGGLDASSPEVVAELRRSLHSERPEIRAIAARLLRLRHEQDPWLEALRSDYDRKVRLAAGADTD